MVEEPQPSRSLIPAPSTVRTGVAGWSYPDWEGIVYPEGTRTDGLKFLSRWFDTIEVNSPFYRIPSPRTTATWPRRVADNPRFRFTVKLYRGFTHEPEPDFAAAPAFEEALAEIAAAERLGAVLVQFPWSFRYDARSRERLEAILGRFERYPLVVEVRHASWNDASFYRYLQERGVGFVNIDQPVIGQSLAPSSRATAPVGYVRLHGRNYQEWFREDAGRDARYDYLYQERELDPWLEKISEVSETASETYVITNNHFRGQAVVNALQIKARIEKRRVGAPRTLVERYPVLAEITESEEPEQGRLF